MKSKLKKISVTVILSAIAIFVLFSFISSKDFLREIYVNDNLKDIVQKFNTYNEKFPEERIYLQLDKTLYKPGETIWFSAYLRNGTDFKASEQSDILNVELISPKGTVISTMKIIAKNGVAKGDFALTEEVAGGVYKIKAYTNYQLNDENTLFFEKEIQVQKFILPRLKMKLDFTRDTYGASDKVIAELNLNTNQNQPLSNYPLKFVAKIDGQKIFEGNSETDADGTTFLKFELPEKLETNDGLLNVMIDYEGQTESISRSIPIVLNNIVLTFYPEGGDLIDEIQTNVAFRALDEFGKPADIEGFITDKLGNQIATFKSFHDGMGAFEFKPEAGKKYFAQISKPKGVTEIYELPEIYKKGFVMNVDNTNKKQLQITVNTTLTEEVSIIAQVRGKIYHSETFNVTNGTNTLSIPTKKFPVGVAQITLFDSKNVPRCERLVFVNEANQLKISIKTDKKEYLPREKVKMTIKVEDERGMTVPTNISLSVVDDQLLSFADDKSGNILSKLLLEQDIDFEVDEPAFYFDKEEADANQALDYLLMTAGWRRYTWEKVIEQNIPIITHLPEKTIIAGVVYQYYNYIPVKNAKIQIGDTKEYYFTDDEGKFEIKGLDISEFDYVIISGNGFSDQTQYISNYSENFEFYIYDNVKRQVRRRNGGAPPNAIDNIMIVDGEVGAVEEFDKNEEMVVIEKEEATEEEATGNVNEQQQKKDDKAEDIPVEIADDEIIMDADEDLFDDRIFQEDIFIEEQGVVYYRAKEFAAPVYTQNEKVEIRNDFRSTIYWNGNIEIDKRGIAVIEFYNCDAVSSFRAVVEGISTDGTIGRAEKTFFTQLPFAMNVKVPIEVVTEDIISIPLTLKNNTKDQVKGKLTIVAPKGLKPLNKIEETQFLANGEVKVIYLKYQVSNNLGEGKFKISFKASGLSDAFEQEIKIVSKGFPVVASFSGQEKDAKFKVNLQNVVAGSITAEFIAYPSVVSDLMQGVASILQEPYGCFEQTSTSSYPDLMVMDYMQSTGEADEKLLLRAENLLDKGYAKLTTYETPEKGYEWFGGAPGHEALTAYGLMQFNDMVGVYEGVDQAMIARTAAWLMSRKDGKGGFLRNSRALDSYGSASEEITNAYIVYALSEAGYTDIKKEAETSYDKAVKNKDPYQMALMANAMYNLKDNLKADKLMNSLISRQLKDGSWTGSDHSITRSTGNSLTIETTSLVLLAMLKSSSPNNVALQSAVKFLVNSRTGGMFGSTQGTILALKALTEYAKFSKKTDESGTIEIYVDDEKVAEKSYEKGQTEAIVIDGLDEYITSGEHKIQVKYIGAKNPLPYSVQIKWNTVLPNSSEECKIDLKCELSTTKAKVGENVRLSVELSNKTNEGQPMTVAIIGIPAGLTAQPWQLKELQEKEIVDYYETSGNNIILYYRDLAPNEIKKVNLDLKAEIPGTYEAPASSAYLYYTNEHKIWTSLKQIEITN